jgi:hypothetical protein
VRILLAPALFAMTAALVPGGPAGRLMAHAQPEGLEPPAGAEVCPPATELVPSPLPLTVGRGGKGTP